MKKQSKLLALLLACAMTLALSACGGSSATTSTPASSAAPSASGSAAATGDKTYTIGICQLVQHNALDAATKGFKDALTEKLGDKVKFDEQNAAGDSATCATICNQFVSSNVDLIMANATPALQAATAATNSIPILAPPSPTMAPHCPSPIGRAPLAPMSPAPPTWLLWTSRLR